MAESIGIHTKVGFFSIESFVGQNIEEMGEFSIPKVAKGFLKLLEKYNERVSDIETDLSLLIEIPSNLG